MIVSDVVWTTPSRNKAVKTTLDSNIGIAINKSSPAGPGALTASLGVGPAGTLLDFFTENDIPLVYPAIRTDGTSHQSWEELGDYTFSLPGTGKITKKDLCGTWTKVAACSSDPTHYSKPIAHNCGHIECQVCWEQPVGKVAKRASSRIRGYAEAALRVGVKSEWEVIINHYQMSPPKGLILPGMEYEKIKEMGRKRATKSGIYGGVMAFHPYRIHKHVSRQLAKQCDDNLKEHPEEREKKYWELVRSNALGMDSWKDYCFWSPHFHIVGFGKLPDQNTDEEKAAAKKLHDGWVVTWIRHVSDLHFFDGTRMQDPVSDLIFYIFSHAGYRARSKIPVWLGACSPSQLYELNKQKQEYQVKCPKCGSPVVMGSEINDTFTPDVQNGEWVTYVHRCTDLVYGIGKNPFPKLSARKRFELSMKCVMPDYMQVTKHGWVDTRENKE